jgi:arylsulfatase A-like enzyme
MMNRSIIFTGISLALLTAVHAVPLKGSRPNIILVMPDDQGYGDLSCHGHPFLKTPNLDKLHGQSFRFTSFHVSPTCAPTRGALMSGKAPFKVGITHTILERERMTLDATTIAEVLKKAGYTTGIFGKWHLGDEDPYQPENRGFDEVFIHGAGGIGQNYPGTQGAVPGTGYFDPIIKHNGIFVRTQGYCTDVFFRQALGWISENKDPSAGSGQAKPFFAYLAPNAPHGPFIVADKYKEPFLGKVKDENIAAFLGMIVNIDENMGLLMQKLEEWELADNTLLIFMTDNGTARGRGIFNAGMKGSKGSVNEGGSRVPLFMRWSGHLEAGRDMDRMTRHYDLFPTFAELAGAELPEDLDGCSLIPLMEYPKGSWQDPWQDRYTFFHQGRWNKAGAGEKWSKGNTDPDADKYDNFAVRSERWRLVGTDQLYDLSKDPGETTNVIKDYPETAERMLMAYEKWWESVRPLMVNEDAPLDTGKPFIEQFEKQKAAQGIPAWTPPEL